MYIPYVIQTNRVGWITVITTSLNYSTFGIIDIVYLDCKNRSFHSQVKMHNSAFFIRKYYSYLF